MPADDTGEKTEQPTSRRREEARENGQVPRSADLTAAVGLIAGLILLQTLGPGLFTGMLETVRELLSASEVSTDSMAPWLSRVGGRIMELLVPFLLLLLVLTLGGAVLQSGLLLTPKKLKPDLQNISPAKGLKKLFSTDSLTRTGLGLMKLALVGLIAYYTIAAGIDPVLASCSVDPSGIYVLACDVLYTLSLRLALVLLVLALVDYFYQRHKVEKQLKMSKQDVKDEMKKMEGDPLLKARRRETQRRLTMQRLAMDVPKADVIVTNPTEYAVALRYDSAAMHAPKLLAKGKDFLALRIRQIAPDERNSDCAAAGAGARHLCRG